MISRFKKMLWALFLIPAEEIPKVWYETVKPMAPVVEITDDLDDEEKEDLDWQNERLKSILKRFEKTWIGEQEYCRRTGQLKLKRPMFPLEMSSKFEEITSSSCTTTNRAEAFNRRIKENIKVRYVGKLFSY